MGDELDHKRRLFWNTTENSSFMDFRGYRYHTVFPESAVFFAYDAQVTWVPYLGTVLNKVDKAGHQELQQAVNLDINII
jgi:hypothetical protein